VLPLPGPAQGTGRNGMGYTLGAAAKAVGMSKTSILRSIKAGRISATRDDFGHWCIEPVELHRVYPAVTNVTEASGTGERAVSGGDAALVEANVRASLLEQRLSDLKPALRHARAAQRHARAKRSLAGPGGTAGSARDHRSAEGSRFAQPQS
jgi:hypothetical protein